MSRDAIIVRPIQRVERKMFVVWFSGGIFGVFSSRARTEAWIGAECLGATTSGRNTDYIYDWSWEGRTISIDEFVVDEGGGLG